MYYKYPLSQKIITYVLMPIVAIICLALAYFLGINGAVFMGILFTSIGFLLIFLSVFGSLMCASIALDDKGITAYNFNLKLKFISWPSVTKVKKFRRWNQGAYSYEDVFHVFDGDFSPLRKLLVNLRGPIVFTDKIRGLAEILFKINEYSRRYNFPLIVLDQEIVGKTAGKAEDVNVTEL